MLTKDAKICGRKIPQYPLFMLSGAICDVFQAFIDYGIYLLMKSEGIEEARTTISWTLSYTISIIIRHQSHRLLVFGEYDGTYWTSLIRTYMAYSSSIVVSMITNHQLVNTLGLSYRVAWIITMLWTGIYNYFFLKATWRVLPKEKAPPLSSPNESNGNIITSSLPGSPDINKNKKDFVNINGNDYNDNDSAHTFLLGGERDTEKGSNNI